MSLGSWTRRHRDALAAGAIAWIACLGVVYATPGDAYWIPDCGNKALVAQRLLDTGFSELNFTYPAAALDPLGLAFPIAEPFAVPRRGGFVSAYPPFYPALAAPWLALLGERGLRVPAALGVAACALCFVVWLAPVVGRRNAAAAGMVLALATPVFFYGITVWEHSLTVALCLAAFVALGRPSRGRRVLAGLLVASACAFREELALLGLSLAIALFLHTRRLSDAADLALGATPVLAAWAAFNWLAYDHPLGVHVAYALERPGGASLSGVGGFARNLFGLLAGFGANARESTLLGASALAALAFGAVAARGERAARAATWLALATGLAVWCFGGFQIALADRPYRELVYYNGVIVQLPLAALAGVGAVRVWRDAEWAALRVGIGASLGFLAVAIVARSLTHFASGGHWSPRVLLPAVPALLALAIAALRSQAAGGGGRRTGAAVGCALLAAAGFASSGLATWILAQQKGEAQRVQRAIASAPQAVVVTNHPELTQQLAPLWGHKPTLRVEDSAGLARVSLALHAAGVREFLFLAGPSGRDLGSVGGARCRLETAHRGARFHFFDMDLQTCTVNAPPTGRPPPRSRRRRR